MHTVHIQLSLDNKPICDGHSVKQIKKPFGFKGCRGIKKKKKSWGSSLRKLSSPSSAPKAVGTARGRAGRHHQQEICKVETWPGLTFRSYVSGAQAHRGTFPLPPGVQS